VSTRTSRSLVSPTRAFAAGADGTAGASAVSAAPRVLAWGVGEAVDVPATGLPVAAGALPAVPGFGTGLTNSACQTYRTRNARKIARRTRRSITSCCGAALQG